MSSVGIGRPSLVVGRALSYLHGIVSSDAGKSPHCEAYSAPDGVNPETLNLTALTFATRKI